MPGENLKPTSPQEYRASSTFVARISPKLVVRIRRSDPLELIFSGMLSFPMLKAAQGFEDVRERLNVADTDEEREASLEQILADSNEKAELRKFAQKYACEMVIEPRIVAQKTTNPGELFVGELDFMELLGILRAEDPEEQGQVPAPEKVEEFRRPEPEPASDVSPSGEDVFPEAELISTPERDYIGA